MADLTFIIERVLTVAVVIAPVALVLMALVGFAARALGDAVPYGWPRTERDRVREEDPAPRWRPELAPSRLRRRPKGAER